MFIASATETITNQTVAVGVLIMILGGLGWIVRQLFSLLPTLLDRLDKLEDRRCQAMEKLAAQIRESGAESAQRIEKSVERMASEVRLCMQEIRESVHGACGAAGAFAAAADDRPGNNRGGLLPDLRKRGEM
jgi:methyl-accepting chemotaxis protein